MPLERSEAQKAAARANGAKSRGPTSEAGKYVSSRNGLKHGMYAETLLLPDEDPEAFTSMSTQFTDVLHPRNELEDLYVRRMIEAEWKLIRVRDYEQAAMMVEISAQGSHPAIPIDDQQWTHKGARGSAAFEKLHGHGGTGSAIQISQLRYLRQFKEAQAQLFKLRENAVKWRIQDSNPGEFSAILPEPVGFPHANSGFEPDSAICVDQRSSAEEQPTSSPSGDPSSCPPTE